MQDPLRATAGRHGARRALVDSSAGYLVSWFSLDDLADTWARRLVREGVQPGQRVAVSEAAGVRFAALLFACLRVGAAMVPLSPRSPAADVEAVLADARPRLLVEGGEVQPLPDPVTGPEGDLCVLYTSGTAGPPKGVRQTLANHVASAYGCRESLGADDRDRWLLVLAPHHVGGLSMFLRSAVCDQPLVTLARFDEAAVLEAMQREHPTLLSVVPVMLTRLLRAGGLEPLRRLRAVLVGGASAPADQVREWAAMGLQVCPTYGLTETSSQVATVPPGRASELAGTAGFGGRHARIELGPAPGFGDGLGEIIVSGPAVSPGYVDPDIVPAPHDGRFATGDLGRIDGGVLTVVGRRDDCIITGGENVQPDEVETVLRAHRAVGDAAVAGRPDPEWGEVVSAWVVGDESEQPALDRWCRERLPPHKVPRRWAFVPELPRTDGGKLVRRLLSP